MIKINLVPAKEKKKRKEIIFALCAAIIFILAVLAMAYGYVARLNVANNLNQRIAKVQKESEGYKDKIAEVKDLKSKEDNLEGLKKTVKAISETQRKILVAVDQLALNLPDGIWFTKISQGTLKDANKFVLQGYSFSQVNLKNYLSNLQGPNGLLKNVACDIKNVSALVGTNKQIQQFEISVIVSDRSS